MSRAAVPQVSRRAQQLTSVLLASGLLIAGTLVVDSDTFVTKLVILGTAIVVGELLELRPPLRAPIPLSLAFFVVLAREASVLEFVLTVIAAELIAFALRSGGWRGRVTTLVERLACAAVAVIVFDGIVHDDSEAAVLGGAFAAIVAVLAVGDAMRAVTSSFRSRSGRPPRVGVSLAGRTADVTIASSAILMTASTQGLDGDGAFGLWGALLFSLPLFMAWYSFERLARARSAYDQTIHALSTVPEAGGWVAPGQADRVAELAVVAGQELGLPAEELDRVTTAALLRDLGRVCLDDPTLDDPAEVSRVGSAVLRATPQLAPAGAILAAEADDEGDAADVLGGRILNTCSALDAATAGRWSSSWQVANGGLVAIAADQDDRVVEALGRGLRRRLPA